MKRKSFSGICRKLSALLLAAAVAASPIAASAASAVGDLALQQEQVEVQNTEDTEQSGSVGSVTGSQNDDPSEDIKTADAAEPTLENENKIPETADAEASVWDGTSVSTDWYTENSDADTFVIDTPSELAGLAALTNGEEKVTFAGKTIRLNADLDMGGQPWTPIGNNTKSMYSSADFKFSGVFDGQGHTVSNIKIDDTENFNRGFFSYVEDAEVRDLILQIDITNGKSYAGGVAAVAKDSVFENIYVKGSISRSESSNLSSGYVGGIVGQAKSSVVISECVNEAEINKEVTASDEAYHDSNYVGGMAGSAEGAEISDCQNLGSVAGGYAVGGIVGQTSGTAAVISRCINLGDICANRSSSTKSYSAGGIAGYLTKADQLEACINYGNISSNVYSTGGIVGCASTKDVSISNCYNAGEVSGLYESGVVAGILAQTGTSNYSTIDVYVMNCYNRGQITGADTATKGGIIGADRKTDLDTEYVKNNYYLKGTAEYGFGSGAQTEIGGAIKSFDTAADYAELIRDLGAAYQEDLSSPVNGGYPILRWQNPDAEYEVAVRLDLDDAANDGGTTEVLVKNSEGDVQTASSDSDDQYIWELPNGNYTYEVTKQGYTGSEGETTVSGNFTVAKASQVITVPLIAQKYEWKIHVTTPDADLVLKDEDGNRIEPSHRENQEDDITARETVYTFELYNGAYSYSASKFGYEEGQADTEAVTGDIAVSYSGGKHTVYLVSTDALGKLTFNVSTEDQNNDVSFVISITAEEGDYKGTIVNTATESFEGISYPAGKYSYTVQASGYQKAEGEFELTTEHKTNPLKIDVNLQISTQWDGTADTAWYTSHEAEDTFYIYTAEELAGLAKLVNDEGETFEGKTIQLMSDLNLGDKTWTPIGKGVSTSKQYFAGTFDGGGHTISVDGGNFEGAENTFGLFGCIKGKSASDRAAVKDLTLYGKVNINSSSMMNQIGGLAGYATYADFTSISNNMEISVKADFDRGNINLGGLVGWSVYNNFSECSNQGNMSGTINSSSGVAVCYAGGIAGMMMQATVNGPFKIVNCYNNGNISSTGGSVTNAGGIAGSAGNGSLYSSMSNCYNSGKINTGQPLTGSGKFTGEGTGNNYYLDTTLGESLESNMGEAKTDAELKALAPVLGDAYKPGSTYPVLNWQAAPYSVVIAQSPLKTSYNDFDDFSDEGLQLTAYYSQADAEAGNNGKTIISGWQVVNGTSLKAGQESVTISYMGVTCEVPITVTQVVHYISSEDLNFDIAAPKAGEIPQSEIKLSDAQKEKIASAAISWYADGQPMAQGETFKEDVYYRAAVTLKSVYEDGNVWYNFDSGAKASVEDTYEILYRTLSDQSCTMTFTLTWKISDTLTDKASHRYYKNDGRVAADYGQYLENTLKINVNGETKSYTVEELERKALTSGIEKTYSYQGLNSRSNYVMTGLPLYDLLTENFPAIINASDESVVTIGDKDYTLGTLRSTGNSYDKDGGELENKLPYLLAYGVDGVPYTSEKGPLYLAAPAEKAGQDNSGNFKANVDEITVNIVTAKTYQVTFSAVDREGGELPDAQIVIRDKYDNVIYSGRASTVELNNGETYTYEITAEGYGMKRGEVSGAATVKAELLELWSGEYKEPAQDENGAYLIYTAEELMWYNREATTVSNERSVEMMAADIELMADIDMSGIGKKWIPMGSLTDSGALYFYVVDPDIPKIYGGGAYTGTFDGNGHVIRNLDIDWTNYYELELNWDGSVSAYVYRLDYLGGLFGMAKGATIKDVGVEGSISVLDRPGDLNADWYQLGGIAGLVSGGSVISGCYTDVDLNYYPDKGNGTVGGYPTAGYADKCDVYAGGIAASLATSNGGVNIIENCYSLGGITVDGTRSIRAGGILGATRNTQNVIEKCYSKSEISVSPAVYAELESIPVYVGGIIGDINSVPMSENQTEISYCFALNPSLSIGVNSQYAHVNRVIGKESFADEDGTANYNFGRGDMTINGAVYTVPEDEQSYRSAAGRTISMDRALIEKTYTNVNWNDGEEEIWSFPEGQTPKLFWEKTEITENEDPDDGGGTGGGGSGGGSGSGSGDKEPDVDDEKPGDGHENCPSEKYSDADVSAWYHESLDFVIEKGLFEGVSADRFAPNGQMTRAMFAVVMARLEQSAGRDVSGRTNPFTDVSQGSWYEEGVSWASDAGIINGIGGGLFAPDKNITREQLASMMYRYAKHLNLDTSVSGVTPAFTDASDISSYAEDAISWAYENDIMTGKDGNRIDPSGSASRAEVAAVMMRFSKLIEDK